MFYIIYEYFKSLKYFYIFTEDVSLVSLSLHHFGTIIHPQMSQIHQIPTVRK
jgi:hypothetical protein